MSCLCNREAWQTVTVHLILHIYSPEDIIEIRRSNKISLHFNPDMKSNLRMHYKEHIERICVEMVSELLLNHM